MDKVWKLIASIAITMLITVAAAWLSLNDSAVSRAEVLEIVAPDKEMLRDTRDELRSIREEIKLLGREIGELRGALGQ
jgi:hypothetical protein